ncbi:cation:proton antiporter [Nocardioides sp. CER19]|uniref:cation:proton antiporter n=1 Tax=Nocardioides sp. CER19 TaxID=3038538 RepID=UPI002446A016|nr:cation:proton antiporter [Nocardioides sp. CER19]MDH2413842.1 cation:proton antiporter [Nocardioides sp. CER19]
MLTSAALASAIALLSPLLIRACRLPFPDVVVLIVLGIVVGPQVLGWATLDGPLKVLSLVGLSFLLFLAGLEVEPRRIAGPGLPLAVIAFGCSFGLALLTGEVLQIFGVVKSPLLIGVILSATALGIVLPVLQDSGQLDRPLGGIVVTAASIAEVVPILLLSVLFSEEGVDLGSQLTLLGAFLALIVAAALTVFGLEKWSWINRTLLALQDTTAQIRIRAAVALLMGFAALAASFGLEAILGSFLAGAAVSLLDPHPERTHSQFHSKLQAVGFGALIPYFFVATGITLNVRSLVNDPATLARVPLFLAAVVVVRVFPAVFYRRLLGSWPTTLAAGLYQGTTLSIPIIGGTIGVSLGVIRPSNFVALVASGLIAVIVFPSLAARLGSRRAATHVTSGGTPGKVAVR